MRLTVRAARSAAVRWLQPAACARPALASSRWIEGICEDNAPGFIQERIRFSSSSSTARGKEWSATSAAHHGSTIYALSSAPGRAAIAVIRVSGPGCLRIYDLLCPGTKPLKPRVAAVRALYAPGKPSTRENILDPGALVLHFSAPATVTGEDILELHVHGGPAIVKAVLGAISRCGTSGSDQIRYAEPGEYTRRAFANNRLDLTQVEALGDILSADTEQQRILSVRGTTGTLAKQYEQWRHQLLYARSELEALIDFSEDQHFDESQSELMASVAAQIEVLLRALQVHSCNAVRGELLRHGITVSLLGAPNAGKSSLLNRIVGREAAIVSSEAGTTRDIVEIGLDLGGYFCRFGDTAGLRQVLRSQVTGQLTSSEAISLVEEEGMRRSRLRALESDVVIVVLNFGTQSDGRVAVDFEPEVCVVARRLIAEKDNVLVAINKYDLAKEPEASEIAVKQTMEQFPNLRKGAIYLISCVDRREVLQQRQTAQHVNTSAAKDDSGGVQAFLQGLIRKFAELTAAITLEGSGSAAAAPDADQSIWQESLGASERHRVLLEECVSHLDAFLLEASIGTIFDELTGHPTSDPPSHGEAEADIVVAAEHLRAAAECLAKITGRGEAGDVEEVLGVIFEKFCVGK